MRKKCRNKARIEASIAEASILEEVSNFTTNYYTDNLPSVHNPLSRYNDNESSSNLSLFKGQLGRASAGTPKTLCYPEWCKIMLYLLLNLDEVHEYQRQFIHETWTKDWEPSAQEEDHLLKNNSPDFISWFSTKVSSNLPCLIFLHSTLVV
jgi:hypothetical protein